MGKIFYVFQHFFAFVNIDGTTEIIVFGRAAKTRLDFSVQTEALAEYVKQFLGEFFIDIPQHTVERNAVHVCVVRVFFQRRMHDLQFVVFFGLRQRALPIGRSYAVDLATNGKRQTALFQPPPEKQILEIRFQSHKKSIAQFFRFVKGKTGFFLVF